MRRRTDRSARRRVLSCPSGPLRATRRLRTPGPLPAVPPPAPAAAPAPSKASTASPTERRPTCPPPPHRQPASAAKPLPATSLVSQHARLQRGHVVAQHLDVAVGLATGR